MNRKPRNPATLFLKLVLLLATALLPVLGGCVGEASLSVAGDEVQEETEPGFTDPSSSAPGAPDQPIVDPGAPSTPEREPRPPFALNRDKVTLLPFHVRLEKLSRVAGVETSDPLFAALRANRYELGDHNFGQNIGADLTWNARKVSLWVEGLLPVCRSAQIRARFPALPEHLNELHLAAFGREAELDDLATYEDTLAEAELPEEARYEIVCLAVLASTEFVVQ